MKIEKIEFTNMVGTFMKALGTRPVTASFAYAVENSLRHFRENRERGLELLGADKCTQFETYCEDYLRELGYPPPDERYYTGSYNPVQWKTGVPLLDSQWHNKAGEAVHWSQMSQEDWDALHERIGLEEVQS